MEINRDSYYSFTPNLPSHQPIRTNSVDDLVQAVAQRTDFNSYPLQAPQTPPSSAPQLSAEEALNWGYYHFEEQNYGYAASCFHNSLEQKKSLEAAVLYKICEHQDNISRATKELMGELETFTFGRDFLLFMIEQPADVVIEEQEISLQILLHQQSTTIRKLIQTEPKESLFELAKLSKTMDHPRLQATFEFCRGIGHLCARNYRFAETTFGAILHKESQFHPSTIDRLYANTFLCLTQTLLGRLDNAIQTAKELKTIAEQANEQCPPLDNE